VYSRALINIKMYVAYVAYYSFNKIRPSFAVWRLARFVHHSNISTERRGRGTEEKTEEYGNIAEENNVFFS